MAEALREKEEKPIGLTVKKLENFSEWYNQVVLKAELADFSSVKGFMVIRPHGYSIWENIQKIFDEKIKKLGHKNAAFPAVIPESILMREKEHVEGFSPEVFWVTAAGTNRLDERMALRPTSETIIYDSYSKWVRSWRDLPLLLNLWNSVFRSETKMTKLFLRTREFLWQEGHTVHATKEEADKEVMNILLQYKDLMESYLAIPVIVGKKTDLEKFAGALYTMTLEALMPDGKALQMGTSHNLGQNFSKTFNIKFLDKDGKKKFAWQTSWGISTRLIGALVMVHGDDKGLVLPPKVAEQKIVVVPIVFEKSKEKVLQKAKELKKKLSKFNPILDDRDSYSAGWKFNEWELKGVPVRVEVGPKDVERKQVVVVRRDTGKKEIVKEKELVKKIDDLLKDIQFNLFDKAKNFLEKSIFNAMTWEEFKKGISNKKLVHAFFCEKKECEETIKSETTASVRCIPLNQKNVEGKCIRCGERTKTKAFFGKSY